MRRKELFYYVTSGSNVNFCFFDMFKHFPKFRCYRARKKCRRLATWKNVFLKAVTSVLVQRNH